jgi:hypothetical protein
MLKKSMLVFLSVLICLVIFTDVEGKAATPETQGDVRPPVIEIKTPGEGEHFAANDYRVSLSFKVTDNSQLKKVTAEVVGERTGIFFTICGEDKAPCKGDPPVFSFDLHCPVFIGRNTLKIFVSDEAGNTAEASTHFYVSPSIPEVRRRVKPEMEPLKKKAISQLKPSELKRERYDLLILAHKYDGFMEPLGPLERLAVHKNNTGMPTKLLSLEEIYGSPNYRGRDHAETIKKALAEFKKSWGIKYVMLVGDADRFPVRYTKIYDLGHWGPGFAPSDLYFADLFDRNGNFDDWDYDDDFLFGEMQGNFPKDAHDLNQDRVHLIPDVAVGRVPVSTFAELEIYVDKVINYENTVNAAWFKRGLLITGDYPGSNGTNDHVALQLQSKSFQIIKLYHDVIWPTTTIHQRWAMIAAELNRGVGFVSFVGHGDGVHPPATDGGVWGGWYDYAQIPLLNNMSRQPVIFSAACSTAQFGFRNDKLYAKRGYEYRPAPFPSNTFAKYRWMPEPIAVAPTGYEVDTLAEHFLVKNRTGGIAFIGSYTGTQGDTHTLAKYFFEAYASGIVVLGDLWNAAVSKFVILVINNLGYPGHSWYTAARYHHIQKMLLFGDPSLRVGGLSPDLVPRTAKQYNPCKDGKIALSVRNIGYGEAGPSIAQVDFFRYGKINKSTPALNPGGSITLIFDVPRRCLVTDCAFKITVDAEGQVDESNENNNTLEGRCK